MKDILFKCLSITDITQKKYQYRIFKRCAEIAHNNAININLNESEYDQTSDIKVYDDSKMRHDEIEPNFDEKLQEITDNVFNAFSTKFNDQIAREIIRLFEESVEECEYDEIDTIIEDFEDVDDSEIISHILENIDIHLFSNYQCKYINMNNTISKLLKNSVNNQSFENDHDERDQKNNQQDINIPMQTRNGVPINKIRSMEIDPNIKEICINIMQYFSNRYDNNLGREIKGSFIKHYNHMIEEAYSQQDILDEAMEIAEMSINADGR